ncbi:MAG: complex I NDUFA9 subunit family protein [Betaproteobacteria bacterium]|nr:complex I NDUFA9 subunit family protein [Betaproteobacteria bacterium]
MKKILLLGGTGFIGSSIAEQLVRRGDAVIIPTRNRERARHLLTLPTVELVNADVHDGAQLDSLVRKQDAVINLIGILHGDFERVHVTLPRAVAEACARHRVPRLIHMSALNAGAGDRAPSAYLQSRGRGEAAVRAVADQTPSLKLTIFQPSVVFGQDDRFLNLFADLLRFSPFVPLGSPHAQFQPVWVEDVARAMVMCLDNPATYGMTYPLVGPDVVTLRELLERVMAATGHRRLILPLGPALSGLQALIFEHLPGKLITRDNVRSMSIPNTASMPFPAVFGHAHSLGDIAPAYLSASLGRARYSALRSAAGRKS